MTSEQPPGSQPQHWDTHHRVTSTNQRRGNVPVESCFSDAIHVELHTIHSNPKQLMSDTDSNADVYTDFYIDFNTHFDVNFSNDFFNDFSFNFVIDFLANLKEN